MEKDTPLIVRMKKPYRNNYHFGNEDRRKKYLSEPSNFQGGHGGLQGLWAMPGRR